MKNSRKERPSWLNSTTSQSISFTKLKATSSETSTMKTPPQIPKVDPQLLAPTTTTPSSPALTRPMRTSTAWICPSSIKYSMRSGKSGGTHLRKSITCLELTSRLRRSCRRRRRCTETQRIHSTCTGIMWNRCWRTIIWRLSSRDLTVCTLMCSLDEISNLWFFLARHIYWIRFSTISQT